jgi:precorrin-6B methylase 2
MARYLANRLAASVRHSPDARPFLKYVPFVRHPEEQKHPMELWPSVAEFFVYDEFLYNALTSDELRNQSYKAALNQYVKGKVVIEIGTGKDAILARFCVEAGAKKVYALERSKEICDLAAACVNALGFSDKITVIHGDANEVKLPAAADVCISEIVGSIGGSEGAAVIINNSRRFIKPGGIILPQRSITKIAGVTFPHELWNDLGFTRISGHYVQKIFEQVGYPFDIRLCIKNFPGTHVLSETGIFEDLDFTKPLAEEYRFENRLSIRKSGRLDGFLVWLTLQTAPGEVIDIFENQHSWLPVYFPVFLPGLMVSPGDTIEVDCIGTLSDNKLNPDYLLLGKLCPQSGEEIEFKYESLHHRRLFKHTPFYQRLFTTQEVAGPQNVVNTETLSEVQLADLLAKELTTVKLKNN